MKKAISLILALALCVGVAVPALAAEGSGDISVTVNGKAVEWTDAKPFIDANSRTMVPLRAVADAMGLKVVWYAAEREAAFTDGSKVIYFPIDNTTALTTGGGSVQMDTAAVIANSRTYAPIRYLAEFFGYTVGWDGATSTVLITKGNNGDFICGETAPHQWKEANYQAPETCTVCGATQGSALTPDFVTYNIAADLEVGKPVDYKTAYPEDDDFRTVGEATIVDYNIVRSDETHAAKDGYEWRIANLRFIINDEKAVTYELPFSTAIEDCYDIDLADSTVKFNEDGTASTHTINYYGEDMESSILQEFLVYELQEDGTALALIRVGFQVPVGYDGCILGSQAVSARSPEDGIHIYDIYTPETFQLFRLS